ncbi:MAG: EAL domain-containing protein [Pseudomonadota bacterium]
MSTKSIQSAEIPSHIFHQIAAERADTGLIIQTLEGRVLWANDAYYRTMKLQPEDVIGQHPLNFAFGTNDKLSDEEIANFRFNPEDYEHETNVIRKNVRGDGTTILLHITLSFYPSETDASYAVLVAREVTQDVAREKEMQEANERLKYIAAHDCLTDVANRSELTRLLDQMLTDASTNGSQIGVMHVDLDRFKEINDTHGHSAGDAVLKTVANRFQKHIRKNDFVARVGGDEFVVVCGNISDLVELKQIANALIAAMEEPVAWNGANLVCGISIGVALSNREVQSVEELLLKSDFALYDAKKTGRGRVALYNHSLHEKYAFETELATDLKVAVRNKDIRFHFQPIVGAIENDVRGLETLVRWNHPKYGMLSPASFLPIAQHIGIMADIDFLAIDAALDLKLRINKVGFGAVRVSINASAELLMNPQFVDHLCAGLDGRGLNRDSIVIEVLETVVFRKQEGDISYFEVLEQLSKAGIRVVLDDFGSGNAGLAQLSKLNVSGLKTDISLIDNLLTDRATELVYTALINLCHDLDLHVVTEGVETEAQAQRVADIGSESMQGFWFTHPLQESKIIDWLRANCQSVTRRSQRRQLDLQLNGGQKRADTQSAHPRD